MPHAARASDSGRPSRSLVLYRLLARLPWPQSLWARIVLICLIGANLPVAVALPIALQHATLQDPAAYGAFAATALATALGAIVTICGVRGAVAPVRLSVGALRDYAGRRRIPELPLDYRDEAGDLMRRVQNTIASFEATQAELRRHAETDPLTGIMNRRSFFSRGREEIARARRAGEGFALLLVDIDHFKSVNDLHGHAAGDMVLQRLAETVSRHLRSYDGFARLGGEEFAILVPGTSFETAVGVAERLRARIGGMNLPELGGRSVTASFGVTVLQSDDTLIDDILARADQALYAAKHNGRNCVMWRCTEIVGQAGRLLPFPQPDHQASGPRGMWLSWEVD